MLCICLVFFGGLGLGAFAGNGLSGISKILTNDKRGGSDRTDNPLKKEDQGPKVDDRCGWWDVPCKVNHASKNLLINR